MIHNVPSYTEELLSLIHSDLTRDELRERLDDYHENDLAAAFEEVTSQERLRLYSIIGDERTADVFSYYEEPSEYLREIGLTKAAKIVSQMDADDAVDALEGFEEGEKREIVHLLAGEAGRDVRVILSYDDDEIGSIMTDDYIMIENDLTVRMAMKELTRQAGDNDNVMTIYVIDRQGHYCGAIDLRDLITARQQTPLSDIIVTSYPYVGHHEKISECIEWLRDYEEDSIPVLNDDNRIIGVITTSDILDAIDDEMGEDYAKFAGMTEEGDLNESLGESMKKRLPWLILLLFLGMGVSTVVGGFEAVVAVIPIVICFQSLILDMAGNVGTQSLAVTIRALSDEELSAKDKLVLVAKEIRVGLCNGLLLGCVAILFTAIYIMLFRHYPPSEAFLVALCVGVALILSMVISSLTGTLIPIFFNDIKVDPAVASGPLITTVNDLAAVVTYYGLVWILLIKVLGM